MELKPYRKQRFFTSSTLVTLITVMLFVSSCNSPAIIATTGATATPSLTGTPNPGSVTATATANEWCNFVLNNFSPPPGKLPSGVPLPPGSTISPPEYDPGSPDNAYVIEICTLALSEPEVLAFMNRVLPANGWKPATGNKSCWRLPPYQWVRGNYGLTISLYNPATWNGNWDIVVCTPI